MPHRHYPPAYLRYLKARLWNLGKPSFWGTAIFLSVVGLGIREYWSNPNLFTYKHNKQVTSVKPDKPSLSAEDKAIAADIDNLPSLYDGLEQVIPTTVTNSKNNSQANKSKSFLEDVISKKQSSSGDKSNPSQGIVNNAPVTQEKNLFVSQAEDLLEFGKLDTGSQFSGVKSVNAATEPIGLGQTSSRLGMGLVNQTDNSQNRNSISPLPTPINQSTNQTLPSLSGTGLTSPNVIGQTSDNGRGLQTPVTNYLPSQTFSSGSGLNNTPSYIQPTVTNSTLNPYSNLGSGQTLPNQNASSVTKLNPQTGYIQPIELNSRINFSNYFNRRQPLPSQVQLQPLAQPITSTPTNVSPYSIQNPSPNVGTSTTPIVPNNYGNSIWQQPSQVPQSNFSAPGQIPGQYTGNVQNNGY
ncbi:hypothetical protein JYQ62_06570 [Nostoc sp. UHCC 0702]|nr:hypothetical protein JYQ62_06570 [Nostoc sp. UHCC 0702]